MTSPALDDLAGMVIAERYRLVRKVGEGGMATVWEAEHMTLGSAVAVKLMRHGAQQSRQARERFLREARTSAQVRHRNVVEIQDFGVTPEGDPFLVMEYLRGETLAQMLDREGHLTPAEAARTISLVLRGLLAVHEQGIIHRDLKPQNVFIVDDPDGRYPKLLDFGVCRSTQIEGDKNLTLEGTIVGTLEYMSPEQARGRKDIDFRTDVYAAGVMLYEALTGRRPYEAKQKGDLLVKVVAEDPVPVLGRDPTIAPAIADVVMKAIAKERDDRFESAREMRDALFAAARAGGFANVESGVVPRIEVQARIARAEAETVADDRGPRPLGAPPRMAGEASEPPPTRAPRRRPELIVVFALVVAAAVAASLLFPL